MNSRRLPWKTLTVGQVCSEVTVGIVIQPSRLYADVGVRCFRSQNVREDGIENGSWVFITEEAHSTHHKSQVGAGDVLIVRSGAPGVACVVPEKYVGSNCIDLVIARPCEDRLRPEFLSCFLNSELGRRQIHVLQGGQAQTHLNVSAVERLLLPIPTLEEQDAIAGMARLWSECIAKLSELINAKQHLKKALMQQLLTGKQRLPGHKGAWKCYRLGQLFDERSESGRGDLPLLSITGDRGLIPREEIEGKDSSSEDKSKYKRIAPGDIGYNTMRMWQGVSAVSRLEGIISPAYTVCIPRETAHAEFMGYLFKFPPVVHAFHRHSQGLVDDTLNLKYHHFSQIQVTVPPVEEQRAIAEVLSICERELTLLKCQLDLLKVQKRGLMQKLLTGQVRVKGGHHD